MRVHFAVVTATGNVPLGAFASCVAPLPQAETAIATTTATAVAKGMLTPLLIGGRNIPASGTPDAGSEAY
jgi:hypothetical protein